MWDFHGSGVWCAECHRELDPSDLPVPEELAERVRRWNARCRQLARAELDGFGAAAPASWDTLEEEAYRTLRELDRYVRAYLYRAVRCVGAAPEPRCPECGRRLDVQGRETGLTWGICEECLLWVALLERGRGWTPRG